MDPRLVTSDEVEQRYGLEMSRCPFCGSPAVYLHLGPMPHGHCVSCEADGPLANDRRMDYDHKNVIAVQLWNKRV